MPMSVWVLVTIVFIGSIAAEVIAERPATSAVMMAGAVTLWTLFVASSPLRAG